MCMCNDSWPCCVSVCTVMGGGDTTSRPSPCFSVRPQLTIAERPNLSFKHAICHWVSLPFQAPGQITPYKQSQSTTGTPNTHMHAHSLTHKCHKFFSCGGGDASTLRRLHTCAIVQESVREQVRERLQEKERFGLLRGEKELEKKSSGQTGRGKKSTERQEREREAGQL